MGISNNGYSSRERMSKAAILYAACEVDEGKRKVYYIQRRLDQELPAILNV